jgi:predicted nucleic acid-binding protein
MAVLFLDSSAIAKAYVIETGSQRVRSLIDPTAGNELYISLLAGVEVISAIVRRRRVGSLDNTAAAAAIGEFRDDWDKLYTHISVDEQFIERAIKLAEIHELRAYDAVQLAAAMALRERYLAAGVDVQLISADDELNNAAASEGMQVENPNSHP